METQGIKFFIYITSSEIFNDQWITTDTGLILPSKSLSQEFNKTIGKKFFKLFSSINSFELIQLLSKINVIISANLKEVIIPEKRILLEIFNDNFIRNRIIKNLKKDFVFFTRTQILYFFKLAILKFNMAKQGDLINNLDIFIKLLLKTNDLLEKDVNHSTTNSTKKITSKLISGFIRNIQFYDTQQFRYLIARYNLLFFKYSKKVNNRKFNLNKEFKRLKGVNIKPFMFITASIITNYDVSHLHKIIEDPNIFPISDNYFKNFRPSLKKNIDQVLKILSNTIDEFKNMFNENSYDLKNKYFGFLCFKIKPLLKFNNIYLPLDIEFLREKMTSEIFWEIFFNIEINEKRNLSSFWGEIFHLYFSDLLRKFLREGKNLFLPNKKNNQEIDAIVLEKDQIILIEFITGKMNYRTLLSGNYRSYQKELHEVFFGGPSRRKGKIKQLDEEIKKINNNKINLPLIDYKKIKEIYPILVFEKAPTLAPGLWEEYKKKIMNTNFLKNHINNLQFMGIDELEMLVPLLKRNFSFVNILKNKLSSQFKDFTFNNFLLFEFYPKNNIKEPINDFLGKEFLKFANYSTQYIFNKNNKNIIDIKKNNMII